MDSSEVTNSTTGSKTVEVKSVEKPSNENETAKAVASEEVAKANTSADDSRQGASQQNSDTRTYSEEKKVAGDQGEKDKLPPGWVKHFSKSQNRNYYFHTKTGKSVWKRDEIPGTKRNRSSSNLEESHSSKRQDNGNAHRADTSKTERKGMTPLEAKRKYESKDTTRSRSKSYGSNRPFRVAIIVPFRDLHPAQKRSKHLERFVPEITDFLSKQVPKIEDFHIFIVEQCDDGRKFNRGKLLNVGFKLARDNYDSFIFHDVDLLPRAPLGEWYAKYPSRPIHIARCWNRYNDNPKYFGGIVAFSRRDFEQIDGFPNTFWGWGGEDDELHRRVMDSRLKPIAPPKNLDAVEDMEEMDLKTKLDVLRKSSWKCMVKWEVADEYKNYRQEKRYSKDRHYQLPNWWGVQGVRFKELSKTSMSGKCTRVTVDLLGNKNDDGSEHWANSA